MCISLHPSKLTGTKLYAGEAEREGEYVHVLAYQNVAESLTHKPNAMVLPIPAVELGPENAIDTREFKNFLKNIIASTKADSMSRGFSLSKRSVTRAAVFDVGSYTVVLSNNAADIMPALQDVPASKRPDLNETVITSIANLYPDWPVAVCCWSGNIQPEPLLWWYKPRFPDRLFAPTLDAHDGRGPTEHAVPLDHFVTFGSTKVDVSPGEVWYGSNPPPIDVLRLLPKSAIGVEVRRQMPNGDFWYPLSAFKGRDKKSDPAPVLRQFPGSTQTNFIEVPLWN